MLKVTQSDLTVGQQVAYKQGHKSSTVTVLEIKNRIKINHHGHERWVTVNSLRGLDNEAKGVSPDPLKKESLPKAVTEEKKPKQKGARPSKAKPAATGVIKPVELISIQSFLHLSPRVVAMMGLILLIFVVGIYLYFNRAQLATLTITPTVMP